MTIDPRLVEKHDPRVREALKEAQRGRLRLRPDLKEKEACGIVELALQVGKLDGSLIRAERNSRDPLSECSDELRDQAAKIIEATRKQINSLEAKWLNLIKAYLNRDAMPNTPIETEYLVTPIRMHLGCNEQEARSIAKGLMGGCDALHKLAEAKPRRAANDGSEIGAQIFHLACVWFDLFGKKPGTTNSDKGRFNTMVADLIGPSSSGRIREAIGRLDDETTCAIQQAGGYWRWILGRRAAYFSKRSP